MSLIIGQLLTNGSPPISQSWLLLGLDHLGAGQSTAVVRLLGCVLLTGRSGPVIVWSVGLRLRNPTDRPVLVLVCLTLIVTR